MHKHRKSYALDQCALYRCGSKRRLFDLLQTSASKYSELRSALNLYRQIVKKKKSGEPRIVYAPRYDLKRIQRRISELLMRVDAPEYLMSPVRGRSNIDNAHTHRDALSYRLMDVADFYPSCRASKVAWFFGKVLRCPQDVVAVLVWLTTHEGKLPQGSPASPILAFLAYREMWDEIDRIAVEACNKLTVYVDDITVSGESVKGETVWAIKKELHKHGHRTKAAKEESRLFTPVIVTGVVLRRGVLLLPNAQHYKRHQVRKSLEYLPDGPDRDHAEAALEGHNETERQILARNPRRGESRA